MLPNIRIGKESISVLLFKTEAGSEEDVGVLLGEAFRPKEGHTGEARLLMAFGDYDLAAIVEGEADRDRLLANGAIPHVLGSREIVAHLFSAPGAKSTPGSLLPLLDRGSVCAISFIRPPGFFNSTPPDEEGRYPGLPDRRFLGWWFDRQVTDPREALLGTAGEPAFVAIRMGDTLEQVYDWVNDLGRAKDPQDGVPLVAKTFTITAIRTPRVPQPPLIETSTRLPEPESGRCGVGISMRLCVSCRPVDTDLWVELARGKMIGNLESTTHLPGSDDFALTVGLQPETTLGEVVDSVLDFRRDAGRLLLDTNTAFLDHRVAPPQLIAPDLSAEVERRAKIVSDRSKPMHRFLLGAEDAVAIKGLPDIGPQAVRALYQFGNMLQNDAINNHLIDLVGYFKSFTDDAKEAAKRRKLTGDPQDEKAGVSIGATDLLYLAERLSPAHHGIDQRTIGSHAGLNPVESNVRHLIGGIHQIIQAAEAIPLAIFDRYLGKLWPGFVVEGPLREYWAHDFQVVGLPSSDLWRPNRWVALAHEALHCLLAQTPDFSFREHPFADVLREIERETSDLQPFLPDISDLALEVVVDLLQLSLGPFWKEDLQLAWLWEYFLPLRNLEQTSDPECYSFAVRGLFLWAGAQGQLKRSGQGQTQQPQFHECFAGLMARYEQWAKSKVLGELGQSALRFHNARIRQGVLQTVFEALWPLQTFVAEHLWPETEETDRRREWWDSDDASDCVQRIRDGITVDAHHIAYPDLLTWRLRDEFPNDDMTVPQRIAAILGFQDCYHYSHLRYRDAIVNANRVDRQTVPQS